MADYVPGPDGDFNIWQANYVDYAIANAVRFGLSAADTTPMTTKQTAWTDALAANATAQAAARSAKDAKVAARNDFESFLRVLTGRLQVNLNTTDPDRLSLGITVKDTTPTQAGDALPHVPVGIVDTSERLRHTIKFYDSATPTRRAKPAGVVGCEIWVKVGDPPSDPSECNFLALDSSTPYVAEYDGADGGKMAHYLLRWVQTNGVKGAWSETVSATIAG